MKLENLLQHHFNYTAFRTGQKEVISSILEGNHTIAMLPTGTGKSLCYQLSGYALSGQVIIISPLLSLMQDQAEQLMMNGEKRVIAFNSFLSTEEKYRALSRLNKYKFIFLSPEMLRLEHVIKRLSDLDIALFVIDEAHCISQWGYDFRPDYLKLGEVREKIGNPLTLALTATATREVKEDIIASLSWGNWKEFIYSVDRPNISLTVETINSFQEKKERLVELVQTLNGSGIVYFSSKKMSEQIAEFLKESGVSNVAAYHGGMEQEARILIQQQFIQGQLDVICATSAFGMGINKDNIRYIIHFHMPLQIESYLQEIGRAGRDGRKSLAILLYSPGDEQLPYQLAEGELPTVEQIDWLFKWLGDNQHALTKLPAFEEEIRRISGLTDIQWRITHDLLEGVTVDQLEQSSSGIKSFIKERIGVKRKKINEMFRWTQLSECRRKNILKYFREDKTIEIEDCCDLCGVNYSIFYSSTDKEEKTKIEFSFSWEDHLGEILLSRRMK
ncbi:RecQ family ATP-dependent DNA helicase [Bacillus sp. DTU_2020_1000418_1_SI_GHA_SEK_038]|uniref:RecQ family ATP-dependent DNA helicase n=1 Tax=Bacillus sp. DTU_2020_1000418_1_SI_GHA_SEK_038 TaxID=3077585 RepID=UPI0028E6B962|nr:RecQ family ATP-dependent DNA helicase [Bacillus sp. DTU_2020_1000418_1_SI_GHA_SEK_038]WNS74074.1 RecQ family ATP-dependent DNA helicase [Bacillus sp. DTU_2020_1000418_1_SI_GHA_SEK_038]